MRNRSMEQSSLRRPIVRAALVAFAVWVGGAAACGSTTVELLPAEPGAETGASGGTQGSSGSAAAEPEGGGGNGGSGNSSSGSAAGGRSNSGGRGPTGGQSGSDGSSGGSLSGGGGSAGSGGSLAAGGSGGNCAPFCGGGATATPCANNSECRRDTPLQPICDKNRGNAPGEGLCVACTNSEPCSGADETCDDFGRCRPPCKNDTDCTLGTTRLCRGGKCVECTKNEECAVTAPGRNPALTFCANNRRCVECIEEEDCATGLHCAFSRCRQCTEKGHCGADQHCNTQRGVCEDDR